MQIGLAQTLPVSPEAAKQNQFQNLPVNLYTGTPQITLPVYTLQEGMLAVPVALAYNASGVRSGDIASWCGLGWNTIAGGMVSRTVRGLPDEGLDDGTTHEGYFQGNFTNNLDDLESDVYTVSLHGATYKFCFDNMPGRTAHFIPESDMHIQPVVKRNPRNNALIWFSGWLLTMPDGTHYRFGN